MKKSGIYQIRNLINDHIYIGSSKDIIKRKYNHFSDLNCQKHDNAHLQAAYNKYGKDNFVFEELITCDPSMLLFYEQQFIDQWKPEYNICLTAGNCTGVIPTIEARQKMSKAQKGKIVSDEQKRKTSIALMGHSVSEESKQKMSASLVGRIGRKLSEKEIENLSKLHKGKPLSEEHRKKLSESHKGKIPWNKKRLDVQYSLAE